MTDPDKIKKIIRNLPTSPGIYQYLNNKNEIIYIGKARNLKKRVNSYFTKKNTGKTKILVSHIHDIQFLVVETESDALLLENNLIKKYQPRYNVLLKDDKTFPWICIKNEPFPRVFSTRLKTNDGSIWFGPYTSMVMVRTLLDLIRKIFPLRTCKLKLDQKNIQSGKYKVCLEYHLGFCKAPCIGEQTTENYDQSIKNIKLILKGNIQSVMVYMKKLMKEHASGYEYEKANYIKEKIKLIEKYQNRSTVVSPTIKNVDVFSIKNDPDNAYVNYLRVINGAIVQTHSLQLKKKMDEDEKNLLSLAITNLRQNFESNAPETIVPFKLDYNLKNTRFLVPQRGDKKKLLDLSLRNVFYFRQELEKRKEQSKTSFDKTSKLKLFQQDLHLKKLPVHMECFDNSNIQGSYPVASCVVFKNGKPSKRNYRHYNIKTVEGANDFASMEEVVFRRYRRLLEEKQPLPQVVFVDGGKGQLNAALDALRKLNLIGKLPVFGIAKRLEEIFVPGDPIPLYLDKNSFSLKLIQQMRNEAHRFGISFHRNKRSGKFLNSELNKIQGIGPKSIEKLLKKYKTVKQIKNLQFNDLKKELGPSKAEILMNGLQKSSK